MKNLKKAVEALGGTVEVEMWPQPSTIICIAPDNYQWVSGQCINMVIVYSKGSKEAIQEALERVSEGLEEIDEEINPQ